MIINGLDGYYTVFDTKNRNTELDTLVIDGVFKGVVGRVARWQGQQRVGVVVDELVTVCTAYVPSAFLEIVE